MNIGIIGLGYVGLPLAVGFAKKHKIIGYDVSKETVAILQKGDTWIEGVDKKKLKNKNLTFTTNSKQLSICDILIVTVPTPITNSKKPDLKPLKESSKTIGKILKRKAIVVYESTVYPGVTEEVCIPILEKYSKLKAGFDFFLAYSPERINPGDEEHSLEGVIKIVSAQDKKTANKVAKLYKEVVKKGIYIASGIKVAEAAKVIENTQRDLNIGLVNELSLIFDKLDIDTKEVLDAAKTKWNFLPFKPGLVGGHCYSGSHKITLLNSHKQKIISFSQYFQQIQGDDSFSQKKIGKTTIFSPSKKIKVLSFDKQKEQAVFANVKCFSQRPAGRGVRITTAGNHVLEVSEKHPVIIEENNEWFIKLAKDIETGEQIPMMMDLPKRKNLRKKIDIIKEMPKSWYSKYRVKRKNGNWKEFKNKLKIKKNTDLKSSNFYSWDYLPLEVFLKLEKKRVMPVNREDILLVSGRGSKSFQSIPVIFEINEDFARFIGYYLSEGCISHDKTTRVRLAFYRFEPETIKDCIQIIKKIGIKRFSIYEDKKWKTTHIKISSELFGFLIEKVLSSGVRSEDANVPEELLYADDNIRFNLLSGLLTGDGGVYWKNSKKTYAKNNKTYNHWTNTAYANYFSSSSKLFHAVQLLLISFGVPFNLDKKRPLLTIHGAENLSKIKKCFLDEKRKKLENYFANKKKYPKSKVFIVKNNYAILPIKSVEKIPISSLCSIEVDKTHTVVTDSGLITHNCISVDPFYLTHVSQREGHCPEVILAGRKVNDYMPKHIAKKTISLLTKNKKKANTSKVLLLGLTFKENVSDSRNSGAKIIIQELKKKKVKVIAHDPHIRAKKLFGVENIQNIKKLKKYDAIIVTVSHKEFKKFTLKKLKSLSNKNPLLIDIKRIYNKISAKKTGFEYFGL